MATVSIAVLFATALAAFAVIFGVRWLLNSSFLVRPGAIKGRSMKIVPAVLATASFPFAWWLGFILGGNFGGATAAAIANTAESEAALIPIGIGMGIFLATAAISLSVACIGLIAMRLFAR